MRNIACAVMMMIAVSAPAGAQAPGAKPPEAAQTPPRPTTTSEPLNIRYELRIREETPGVKPTVKTVAMIGTVNEVSLVRAVYASNPLNVDITPTGVRELKVRTKVGVEYQPAPPPDAATGTRLNIRQNLHVWLDSGKPMVISESVDPSSDRRFIVEVTATILR
jgi:hypothetical protein